MYVALCIVAPVPRAPLASEKRYRTIGPDGHDPEPPRALPCWQDEWIARKEAARRKGLSFHASSEIDEPELLLSVVVPAYNEEARLPSMLDDAVAYLEREQGVSNGHARGGNGKARSSASSAMNGSGSRRNGSKEPRGWEIVVVSDGSTDRTTDVALRHARAHGVGRPGSAGSMRVVSLEANRGKGGAVTHGMRHVRGQYVLFADADGASTFSDLAKLMRACRSIADEQGRAIAIGSRAHLVGSEAVVKVGIFHPTRQEKPPSYPLPEQERRERS